MNIFERQKIIRNNISGKDYLYLLFKNYMYEERNVTLINQDALKRRIGKTNLLKTMSKNKNYPVIVRYQKQADEHANAIWVSNISSMRGNRLDKVFIEEGFTLQQIREWIIPYVKKVEFGYYS